MRAFTSGLSVNVVSCFEANTRRRRGDGGDTTTRKAFRVCVYEDDLERLLNANLWPDSVTISQWFFKSASNTANANDKRSRVDSECLLHETQLKTSHNQTNTGVDTGVEAQSAATDNDATIVVNYEDDNMDLVTNVNDGI